MGKFLQRLKQRKLVQWGLAYAAFAFALLQGVDIVAHQFDWPGGVQRGLTLALTIGFFAALVLAWYHGERGVQRVTGTELLILALLLAIGGGLLWRFGRTPASSPDAAQRLRLQGMQTRTAEPARRVSDRDVANQSGTNISPDSVAAATSSGLRVAAAQAVPIPAKSIAVLPFVNMSGDPKNEYFSDGMSEELLNALAQVKDLKVAGRTSSFYYKGRNEDLRTIGKALGVANILEGSVRKQGDKVRITAQLIRVADDTHLWSHAYDGNLSDVFKLQEDIARSVTDQLKIVLVGDQKTRLVPVATTSPEAHALYLQATAIFNRRDGTKYQDAVADLQRAIRLDPNYARAYSRLAALYVVIPSHSNIDVRAAHAAVLRYARRASALDPGLAEPWAATGFSWGKFAGHFTDQRAAFERALKLDPDDVTTNFWFGLSLAMTGYRQRGIELMDRALKLDPMLPNALRWRGIMYFYAGDLDHAEELLKRARDLGLPFADHNLADVIQARGDSAAAAKLAAGSADWLYTGMPSDTSAVLAKGIHGDAVARQHALALIETYLAKPHEHIPGLLPVAMARLGEPARALEIERTQQTGDTTDFLMLLWSPQGRALRALPEFPAFLRDFGLVALWDKYGAPDVCQSKAPDDYACTH